MLLQNAKKTDVETLITNIAPRLVKDPLFMFYCNSLDDRPKFINAFLKYYIPEWSGYDIMLTDENRTVIVTLVDPLTFEFKFRGKGARGIKRCDKRNAIFEHRRSISDIMEITTSPSNKCYVMNVYGNLDADPMVLSTLIDEAITVAKTEGAMIVYETFSQKLLRKMHDKGFTISYQKFFNNTRYVQSAMVYSPKVEVRHKSLVNYEYPEMEE